jgi:hypothetical protein
MRKVSLLAILMATSLCTIAQNKTTFWADKDTASEEQIKRLELMLTGLLEKGDIDTYSGYLTEDYIRITANGQMATKQEVLQMLRKIPANTSTMHPHDLKVQVYENTAILHVVLDLETKSGDTVTRRTSLITKVFIKRNGNWYMASLQGTAVQ